MYLMIKNKGEIELEAITLMGATNKEGSNKIGFFGSGNKYALSTLLRFNIPVRIFSGLKEYIVTTENVTFRGQVYQRILIDNIPTSLTTRMGPAWEPWMAVREFYSNALDEGLIAFECVSEIQGSTDGETSIFIQVTPEIQEVINNMSDYFNQSEAVDTLDTGYGRVDILDNQEGRRYRKGIACVEDEKVKSCFSYNFDDILINESRVIAYDHQQYEQIASALAMTQDPSIISRVLDIINDEEYLEARARWEEGYCGNSLSQTWSEVLVSKGRPVISQTLAAHIGKEESIGTLVLPDTLVAKIKRDLPEVPMFGSFDGQSIEAIPSEELQKALEEAAKEIESWGYNVPQVKWRKFINSVILAQVYKEQIYFSVDCPLSEVIETLYEEITHIITGLNDCTRSMQDFLFRKIISLQREIHKKTYCEEHCPSIAGSTDPSYQCTEKCAGYKEATND